MRRLNDDPLSPDVQSSDLLRERDARVAADAALSLRASFASGSATLVAGTVTVNVPGMTASSIVMVARKTCLGTVLGSLDYAVSTDTLTISSRVVVLGVVELNLGDESVVSYVAWNP